MKNLVPPVVNNNGNSKSDLVNQIMNIANKLEDAVGALYNTDIYHGRNFQTCHNSDEVRDAAIKALGERIEALQEMKMDFVRMGIEVSRN